MKQLSMIDDLGWLLDEEWLPNKVTTYTNVNMGMTSEQFDDYFAMSMGYDSNDHMIAYNYKKDKETYLKYGDRTKGLI